MLPRTINHDEQNVKQIAEVRGFVRLLWPENTNGYLLAWTPDKFSRFYPVTDAGVDDLARTTAKLAETTNVYTGCGLSPTDNGRDERCKADAIAGVPGLWLDVDLIDSTHKRSNLPPDIDAALSLLREMPLPFSFFVRSGHGLHAWWLFCRPWIFASDEERKAAQRLAKAWEKRLHHLAEGRGWKLDSVADLARVLRAPGTINRKDSDNPVRVTAEIPETVRRYSPREMQEELEKLGGVFLGHSGAKNSTRIDDREKALRALRGLNPNRSVSYEDWYKVGMCLHSVDSSEAMLANYIKFSMNCPEKCSEKACRDKWASFTQDGGLTIGSLILWAQQDGGWPTRNGPSTKTPGSPSGDDASRTVKLADLLLVIESVIWKPSGKMIVAVAVIKDGNVLDHLDITKATHSRRDAEKRIAQYAGVSSAEAAAAVGKLIDLAENLPPPGPPPQPEGETLKEIVEKDSRAYYAPKFRTSRGTIWSESLGREISRPEFVTSTPGDLLDRAEQAVDAPRNRDGVINRSALHRAIKTELEIAWSTIGRELKTQTEVELDKDSEAGQQVRRALVRIWKQTATFEAARNMSNTSVSAARSSLAARTRKAAHLIGEKNKPRASGKFTSGKWQAVQKAFDAYWRFDGDAEGNSFLRLAIKFEITFQIGVQVPGAVDQRSLNRLAKQYGLATTDEDVKDRLTGGGRLLVFSDDLTEEILQTPEEFYEEDHERAFD